MTTAAEASVDGGSGGRVAKGFRVIGRVQGVGFRSWTQEVARELGLRGWVRNAADGSVELLAEGPAGALEALEGRLASGPAASRVQRVVPLSPSGDLPERGFEIRR